MPQAFTVPIAQTDLTHADLSNVIFDLENETVQAQVAVGEMDPDFETVRLVHFQWTQEQVLANLTAEERQALASIRDKIVAYIESVL